MKPDLLDKLRAQREKHADLTSPLSPRSQCHRYHLRARPISMLTKKIMDKKSKPPLPFSTGLSFRFEPAESQFVRPGIFSSITTPERSVKVKELHSHPTGTMAFLDYRNTQVPTPLSYLMLSKQTPVSYVRESVKCYTVTKKDLVKPRLTRKPSNQVLFKESACDYAQRKKMIFKKGTRFELCHNLAHRFMGNKAQERDNIFVQTAHFNSQQLVVETVISTLAIVLEKIEVKQTCERFEGGNIARLVRYELVLPGCSDNWEVTVHAAHAQIAPHIKSTEIHLSLIADELMKSRLPEIKSKGKNLKKKLEARHQKKKIGQEKKSFAFHGALSDPLDKNVDFNL